MNLSLSQRAKLTACVHHDTVECAVCHAVLHLLEHYNDEASLVAAVKEADWGQRKDGTFNCSEHHSQRPV